MMPLTAPGQIQMPNPPAPATIMLASNKREAGQRGPLRPTVRRPTPKLNQKPAVASPTAVADRPRDSCSSVELHWPTVTSAPT